jgi:hypothetical protein
MPVFHVRATTTNPTENLGAGALLRLQGGLEELSMRQEASGDFEAFEREVCALFAEAECEVLGEALERLDVDVPYVVIEGRKHHRVLRGPQRYTTAAGPVSVQRTLYRAGRERSVVPMELRAGIAEGQWTPRAARLMSLVSAQLSSQEGESMFRELGRMRPSKSSLDRLPKRLSARWEARREEFEASLRAEHLVAEAATTIAASLDGVMVPMKDGKRQEKRAAARAEGKRQKGPAGYQEAGCATVSFFDANGERLETLRLGRMPQAKKATLKEMLAAEVNAALAQRPELRLVKLADGTKDNWTYLGTELPVGDELVDFYHAAEQLSDAFDAAYGENSPAARAQFEKHRHRLRYEADGVEKVIRALVYLRKKHPKRKRIRQVLKYFRRNRHRMRYAEAAAAKLPTGSGIVEAACKTLVTQRMKRSGMRWRHEGGQAILTLRALVQSERFERGWQLLAETYRADIKLPDNVVPFPTERAH